MKDIIASVILKFLDTVPINFDSIKVFNILFTV